MDVGTLIGYQNRVEGRDTRAKASCGIVTYIDRVDGWMDGWMDGKLDRQVNRQVDRYICVFRHYTLYCHPLKQLLIATYVLSNAILLCNAGPCGAQ